MKKFVFLNTKKGLSDYRTLGNFTRAQTGRGLSMGRGLSKGDKTQGNLREPTAGAMGVFLSLWTCSTKCYI